MSFLEVRRRTPTPPELSSLEGKIIDRRREYALADAPGYEHHYIGFIEENIDQLFFAFEDEIESYKAQYPDAEFSLEYHSSCIAHSEYPHEVYSFTLTKKHKTPQGERRQLVILSWKVPFKDNYDEENTLIESFMAYYKIKPYDDGSGVRCKIIPAQEVQEVA